MSKQCIKMSDLNAQVALINRAMGTPTEPYKLVGGKYIPQAGCYHLEGAYGGHKLVQMSSKDGSSGTSDALNTGFVSKRELYNAMFTFRAGIDAGQSKRKP